MISGAAAIDEDAIARTVVIIEKPDIEWSHTVFKLIALMLSLSFSFLYQSFSVEGGAAD
jgi:hypothetical protein